VKEQLSSIFITALQALGPVIAALLGLVALKLHALIDTRVKNEKVQGILDRLDDAALTVVQEVEQTVVSKLDPNKPLPDNGKAAKDAAIASLKTHLGQKGVDEAKKILGVGDSALEQILVSYIESKVHLVNQATSLTLVSGEAVKPIGGAA
jgi:hypothetical protein